MELKPCPLVQASSSPHPNPPENAVDRIIFQSVRNYVILVCLFAFSSFVLDLICLLFKITLAKTECEWICEFEWKVYETEDCTVNVALSAS